MQLYYWDIRALGEPIRLMLEYLGVEYENKHPTSGEEWFASKFDQGIELAVLNRRGQENTAKLRDHEILDAQIQVAWWRRLGGANQKHRRCRGLLQRSSNAVLHPALHAELRGKQSQLHQRHSEKDEAP